MKISSDIRLNKPAHPGAFVRYEIIEPLELTIVKAADVLGVTRQALSAFLNEKSSLSAEMAIRIEKAFGVSMETLMRMQNSFDIAQAKGKRTKIRVGTFSPEKKCLKGKENSSLSIKERRGAKSATYLSSKRRLKPKSEVKA